MWFPYLLFCCVFAFCCCVFAVVVVCGGFFLFVFDVHCSVLLCARFLDSFFLFLLFVVSCLVCCVWCSCVCFWVVWCFVRLFPYGGRVLLFFVCVLLCLFCCCVFVLV